MSRPFAIGAAMQFTEKELGGPVVETENVVAVDSTPVRLVAGNGDRVGLVVINLGAANAYVALSSVPSSSLGLLLGSTGGNMALTVRDDFTLTSREWWAVVPAGGPCNLYVLEYSRFTTNKV